METVLTIDRLRVSRGGSLVLNNVTAEVASGRVAGLLGASGSGKSTLMRSIVGVQRIDSGKITVLNLPAGAKELRRKVGYVSQSPAVYLDLTVIENLNYFSSIFALHDTRVEEVLERVSLSGARKQLASSLSGGQRARLSLALALLPSPAILVLDEPTVGLDPLLREELWDHFHELASQGCTLLVSSHVMDEAERCDDLVLLRDGQVIFHSSPANLKASTEADNLDSAFLTLAKRAKNEF
ncbi:MAG: ABC transporter ATP-binding protein [Acidimicrobiaceae bacterium]|nr:ABC transporter ATP-binding protein [Acidimicrobiaceae bacterium]